ncbi:hypothetical protein QYE76_029826 [Lolium multiflorum]|uniref:Uncharacterized protein n=1 Tax=Lolium multiflorum TaxID=4521 RepID=A0AAD8VIN1_LOLMU|nr:hypothetical protein QYE76_029826 [Lolium multiflorum]
MCAKENTNVDQEKNKDIPAADGFRRFVSSLHTFTGVGARREKKVLVNVNVMPDDVPRWLNWSEQSITWSRIDHALRVEYPDRVTHVVKPNVAN